MLILEKKMKGSKSLEPIELMLLALCSWHLSLIEGNLAMAYYSKTVMPPDLSKDGRPKNSVQHLILDSNEAVLLTAIIRETITYFFAKDEKQGEDNAEDTRTSWETLKAKSLSAHVINSNNVTSRESGISYSI